MPVRKERKSRTPRETHMQRVTHQVDEISERRSKEDEPKEQFHVQQQAYSV